MKFSFEAKELNRTLWEEILSHPFVLEIGRGVLPLDKFRHYLAQDSIYLEDLLSSILIAGSKAKPGLKRFLIWLANETVNGEMEMQRQLKGLVGSVEGAPTPTTLAYTSYIIRVAYLRTPSEFLAALAPCFWSYAEIGVKLSSSKGVEHEVYGVWIKAYSSEEYQSLVSRYLDILDKEFSEASDEVRAGMRRLFSISVRYEKMFWDMAYNLEAGIEV